MVSTYRRVGALLAVGLGLAGALLPAAPALAGDVFVEVNPSTVQAGFLVGIRAGCGDNQVPATVESAAFGTVTVQPQGGFLTGAALVPERTQPREYRVKLACPNGRSASTTLTVTHPGPVPSRGPATGFGGGAHSDPGDLLLGGGIAATLAGAVLGVVALRRRGHGSRLLRDRSVS